MNTSSKNSKVVLSVEDLKAAIKSMQRHPPNKWLLLSPDGMLYSGTARVLLPILFKDVNLIEPYENPVDR